MKGKLSPSLTCADVLNLQSELEALDNLGVDFIHLDFMDNKFVPNITLDTHLIKSVKSVLKNMRRDIHIMAYEPVQYFDRMDIGEGDIVAVHYEACPDLADVIGEIRKRQASPFIAISPDTKPEVLLDYLDIIIEESEYEMPQHDEKRQQNLRCQGRSGNRSQQDSENDHDAAHGRRPALRLMAFRPFLTDALPELQPMQHRQ